ncbi:cell adhesion molecule 4-like [Anneissia japonica]|uniref:cell adhesion molecule 4-like n=1 Tax=Anneissia japonica TaxID=1529436 RepID=UPI00142578E9|nr:cell adhesion molecule 4-like [Anneissia japonica]
MTHCVWSVASVTSGKMVALLVLVTLMYSKPILGVEFTELLSDKNVTEGKYFLWNCYLDELKSYQKLEWFGYDKTNPLITYSYEKKTIQATLKFSEVSRTDEGLYHCAVVDKNSGNVLKRTRKAKLTVIKVPLPSYPICEANPFYKQGDLAEISCCSEKTKPIVSLEWTRNGYPIGDSDLIHGKDVCSRYKFLVNINDDNVIFNCTMSSVILLKPRSCTVGPLNVKYQPIVELPPVNITIGIRAIIMCQATANPNAIKYSWETSPQFQYKNITDHVMVIDRPDVKLNGTVITCIAENEIGASRSSIIVKLHSKSTSTGRIGSPATVDPMTVVKKSPANILSTVLLIAGSCTMVALLLMITPLCYCFFSPRHNFDYLGRCVQQPEVYFQAKELPREHETPTRVWKRSCATQVPEDIASFYAELPCGDDDFVDKV